MRLIKFIFIFFSVFLLYQISFAQVGVIKGVVKDEITGETIVGAAVTYAENKGVATDLDGNFKIEVVNGEYTVSVNYVGFLPKTKKIIVNNNTVYIEFALSTKQLTEVEVVADIAIARKTPVAFSNLSPLKIQEALGSNDLPMLLNTTPGVYATQGGGGDGDSRISIRGFSQRNVAVMIDGVPMNDMENGQVYWSNWFGLDNLQKGTQVQRGLGASKLAIPAVGGSINILTAGVENKKQITVKQEYTNFGNPFTRDALRTAVNYSSGRLNNGWGVTAALSVKKSDSWVDGLNSRALFYFLRVDKLLGAHTLSISAFGAPQEHGQRFDKRPIATYSHKKALELGVDTNNRIERGMRYNSQWNYITRNSDDPEFNKGKPDLINGSLNYFYKPVISLRDFWTVNDKLYISNVAYASFGKGGGAISTGTFGLTQDGLEDYQFAYDQNSKDSSYLNPETGKREAEAKSGFIASSVNNHNWFGLLSTATYKATEKLEISGGIDLRDYTSFRYQEVYDLLGADVILNNANTNQESNVKRKGDMINRNTSGFVRWGGLFAMAEYKADKLSAFINVSGSFSGVKQVNYFVRKDLVLTDTTLTMAVGNNETVFYNGDYQIRASSVATITSNGDTTFVKNSTNDTKYIVDAQSYTNDSKEAVYNQTPWKRLFGYTIKGGANYNINDNMNVFFNLGYLDKAPLISNVIRANNTFYDKILNEKITGFELGYSYATKEFKANINAYHTVWKNRPTSLSVRDSSGNPVTVNAIGMGAKHIGIEFDATYQLDEKLSVEGMISLGDWKWNSIAEAYVEDAAGNPTGTMRVFDPRGVKVGDAAQRSYAINFRYVPIKRLYIKPQYNFFTHNYANFDPASLEVNPITLIGKNTGRQSWRMPNYGVFDFSMGYGFQFEKWKMDLRSTVNNLLDTFYVADAQNNANGSGFDANSALVYIGLGRRITVSLSATF